MPIMTVRGPIEAAQAGYTLSHEHLLCDLWPIVRSYDGILDDESLAARELSAYRDAGGRTLVDVTSGGLGRNPLALRRISEAAGVNVVMGAAWYREDVYPRCVYELDSSALAGVIVDELTRGVDGTDVLAGIIGEIGTDRNRVFGVGLSEGGYMAIRLALEAPSRFRAVAPVEANLPAPENFQCKPVTRGGASVVLFHGTKDRLVPFEGGEGSLLFGLLKNPKVLSARATAQYFADLDAIAGRPVTTRSISADGFGIERFIWSDGSGAEIELIAIDGAGHTFPQPYYRARRILGSSPRDPNAAEVIWAFFERQRPR